VDDITVFEVEAENIRRRHPALLHSGAAHAAGACAFLDAGGACRIYESRPYVCRTQGYPLRWVDEEDPAMERRDICPLNEEGPSLESLPAAECWTLGPFEGRLAVLQQGFGGRVLRRVALRDLFAR
jgi:hypothetical protein